MKVRSHSVVAVICLCCAAAPCGWAYANPIYFLPFEQFALAPVIATGVVEETNHDSLPAGSGLRVVTAHAALRVLRSFPQSVFAPGERLRLDYEALSEVQSLMGGPTVPQIRSGDVAVLPLKLNSQRFSAPWRLIADEGRGLVIPAIAHNLRFTRSPKDGRTFLQQEIASALLAGTRGELFAAASYANEQRAITSDLTSLLESKLADGDNRWSQIVAETLRSMGVPRPSIADLRAGKDMTGGDRYYGSLITALLQKLRRSQLKEFEKL